MRDSDLPAELRGFTMDETGTRFVLRPMKRHPYLLFALPFAAALWTLGVAGVITAGGLARIFMMGVLGFAVAVTGSCAMAFAGREELRQGDGFIARARGVGPLARERRIPIAGISSLVATTAAPSTLVWPGQAGTHLALTLSDGTRQFLARGMQLPRPALLALARHLGLQVS